MSLKWRPMYLLLAGGFCLCSLTMVGQQVHSMDSASSKGWLDLNPRVYQSHDTVWIYSGICKTLKVSMLTGQPVQSAPAHKSTASQRQLLLAVTGDAGYQRFDRNSSSDNLLLINTTSETSTLRLNAVYKNAYPFFIFFRYNQSSPFQLDNQYEINIGFDNRSFRDLLREKISNRLKNQFLQKQTSLYSTYNSVFRQYQEQKEILESPAYIQREIQNRFRGGAAVPVDTWEMRPGAMQRRVMQYGNVVNNLPAINGIADRVKDSANARIEDVEDGLHARLEKRRDSLQRLLTSLQDSISDEKNKYALQIDSVNRQLSSMGTAGELRNYADQKGIADSIPRGKWTDILMKTDLRVGKFILNCSELTINNIFLQGVSVRYGDQKFIQVSVGLYDFAFREMFRFRDSAKRRGQFVTGIKLGQTDGNNLKAINFYLGRKEKSGSIDGELRTVAGMSVERKFHFNKHLSLDLELAKSTTKINSAADKQEPVVKDLFGNLSMRTIGGYAALEASLPQTKTDIAVAYRYWGQQFESFNASQYFNPQNNLSAKISQPFFHRRLYVSSNIRYTDFKSYGIASNIKSKTVFASVNATLRLKKIPVITVGYYPGSQLYWMENSKVYEYFYYVFNASASHYFRVGKLPMQTVFTYNKFFNKYTDSLVSGAQSYYNVFWTAWWGKFSYQANYSHQQVEENTLSTIEGGLSYGGNKLRIGGTVKWNYTQQGETRFGYTANMGLLLGKIGTVNFIYDRSFLPDRNSFFIPVSTAQLQIIKPLKFRIWQKG